MKSSTHEVVLKNERVTTAARQDPAAQRSGAKRPGHGEINVASVMQGSRSVDL
jgi:hypothetical protein